MIDSSERLAQRAYGQLTLTPNQAERTKHSEKVKRLRGEADSQREILDKRKKELERITEPERAASELAQKQAELAKLAASDRKVAALLRLPEEIDNFDQLTKANKNWKYWLLLDQVMDYKEKIDLKRGEELCLILQAFQLTFPSKRPASLVDRPVFSLSPHLVSCDIFLRLLGHRPLGNPLGKEFLQIQCPSASPLFFRRSPLHSDSQSLP